MSASETIHNPVMIYSDGERFVQAVPDREDRKGGTMGHHYKLITCDDPEPKHLYFQNGNPKQFHVNGHTNETILSILIHRMEYLDSLFPCDENKEGLEHLRAAKLAFEARAKRLAMLRQYCLRRFGQCAMLPAWLSNTTLWQSTTVI